MTVREAGDSPVVILGRHSEVSESLIAAFRRHGVPAGHGHSVHAAVSMIVILDQHAAEALFGGRHSCASRKRLRAWEDDACESAVETALTTGARRLLTVCDARRLSFGQRLRAVRCVHGVAQRVGYECSMNGLQRLVTSYALIDTGDDLRRVADAAVTWHEGTLPEGSSSHTDVVLRR